MQQGAKQVYCFEPCDVALGALRENLDDNGYQDVPIFPYAVSNENKQTTFSFYDSNIAGAHIASVLAPKPNTNNVEVKCVKIDDWCAEHQVKPTYIKMDIEGGENEAQHGAAETIKSIKPKLAICLYHRMRDMWEIPLYVHQLVPEYRFYCKKTSVYSDFVMYATV